jgi:hypothetical protein
MISRTIRHISRVWQPIAAVFLLSMAGPAAAVQEIRVVGVGVESSSLQAGEYAMNYAKKRAVFLATRKLGVPNPSKAAAKIPPEDMAKIVRGANVVNERRVGEITYLDVHVTIVDEALRRALKLPPEDPAKDANLRLRGVLLLSVYADPARAYMWEKENKLRAVLSDEIRRQARGGVLLPGGDLEDLRLIDYQNALTVKADELAPMFKRYGAQEIIIAILTPGAAGTMDPSSVLLRRLKPDFERNELLEIPPEIIEETPEIRLAKSAGAIASAVTQIASSTAEIEQAQRAGAKKLTLRFSYAVPKELARMQEAVRSSPEVLFLDLPSIALARVGATVYLKGEEEALRLSLAKQGIIVTSINGGWRLSVR